MLARHIAGLLLAGLALAAAVVPAQAAVSVADVLRAVEAGHYAWARAKAEEAGGTLLKEYVDWRELRDATPVPGFKRFRSFLAREVDWPSLPRIRIRAEDALDSSVDDATVLAFFADHEPVTRQGRTRLAIALLGTDEQAAASVAGKAWVEGRFSATEERYFLAKLGRLLTRDQDRLRLDNLLAARAWEEARRQAKRLDQGRQRLAEARILLQSGASGIDRAVARVPDALKADPGLSLDRIERARKDGRDARARELLLLLNRSAERQPAAWWRERHIQIRDRIDAGAFKEAYRLAAAHRQPKDHPSYADAEWLAGWLALSFLDRPKDAAAHFSAMTAGVSSPISLARGNYWTGRAQAASGANKAAEASWRSAAAFGTTFYGQLAWLESGRPPQLPEMGFPEPDEPQREAFEKRRLVRLARLLCDKGGDLQAGAILSHLASEALDEPVTLGQVAMLATDCHRLDTVVQTARLAQRSGSLNAAAAFPAPPFVALAERSAVDPALLTAIARQESQFYPRAQSPAGALGLLQLMPGTARAMARKQGMPYADVRLLTDPGYNVTLGRTYLEEQLGRWGEPALAIAAYNAGPRRVDSWIARYGDPRGKGLHRLVDWMELIPFTETRNYVQRVLEGRNVYRLRFGWNAEVAGHPFTPGHDNPS
ncbi:MAG TPA: lytic transglycosylase domain-containing protein [Geminicoccus sp.]|uniref:lytic transglycosylase domain-containing protein n=1 Tax=Geminicoccus sp. TaxID=2024832 RepID=UPI002D1436B6|nr:lytic transglycosylase domain-containing protein [Geminicoccus sp.]HWL70756.1 lytic transglycosylase domain-containing protein [Geminicoccus sp.]